MHIGEVASRRSKVIEADGREPQSPETLKETPPKIDRRISTNTMPVPKEIRDWQCERNHRLLGKRPLRDSLRDSDSGGGHHPLKTFEFSRRE
jgi:hypothetical protein